LGKPKGKAVTLAGDFSSGALAKVQAKLDKIYLLGDPKPLMYSSMESSFSITLPEHLPGEFAYVIKLPGYAPYGR